MAVDPSTKIILSGEDRTKAAFASATRNLEVFNARARSIGEGLSSVARFGQAGGGLLAFGAAAAVAAGAMITAGKHAIDLADNLNDISKRTGISVETLSGLRVVADQSGTSIETLARALKFLQKDLVDAGIGLGDNIALFKDLGIVGLGAEDALFKISDAFQKLEDPEKRAALATAIFKKGGQELIPLLIEGGDKLRKYVEEGRNLTGITKQMAEESDKFNDSIRLIKAELEGIAVQIAGPVVEALNRFIERVILIKKLTGSVFGDFLLEDIADPFRSIDESIRSTAEELKKLKVLQEYLKTPNLTGQPRVGIQDNSSQIALLEKRMEYLRLIRKQGIQSDPRLKEFDKITEASNANAIPQIGKFDIDLDKLERQKELISELKKLKEDAARFKFIKENFDFFPDNEKDKIESSQVALAKFLTTAGKFKGLDDANKFLKLTEQLASDQKKIDLSKAVFINEREADKLEFLREQLERFGQEVIDTGQAAALFDVIMGKFGSVSGSAIERFVKSVGDLGQKKKDFDFAQELQKTQEEINKLAFSNEVFAEFGSGVSSSAEAAARFETIIGKFSNRTPEAKEKIIDLAQAMDKFRASLNAKGEIAQFDRDLEHLTRSIAELRVVGNIDQFSSGRSQAKQLLEGPLRAAPPEEKAQVKIRGEQIDSLARTQALDQFTADVRKSNDELKFQSSLIGLSVVEQQKLTEARKIQLETDKLLVGASGAEAVTIKQRGALLEEESARAIQANSESSRSFTAGWDQAFTEYVDKATDASAQARELFSAATEGISDGLYNALQGRFDKIGDSFKRVIDKMVADYLTAQALIGIKNLFPDIGNAFASFSGNAGASAGASAAGKIASSATGTAAASVADTSGIVATNAAFSTLAATTATIDGSFATLSAASAGLQGSFSTVVAGSEIAGTQLQAMLAPISIAITGIESLATASTTAAAQIAASSSVSSASSAGSAGIGFFSAKGNIFEDGDRIPFARGGVVSRPTYFPMRNGSTGLMGEAGPEAIMPLRRTRSGKLGVRVINRQGREDSLPLARDSAGRLAVRAFAKGAVFHSGMEVDKPDKRPVPYMRGGAFHLGEDMESFIPFARGGIFHTGELESRTITPFAQGGLISPVSESVKPSKQVTPQLRAGDTVSITLNIATPDAHSFRAAESQMQAQLARMVSRARRNL